MADAFRHPPEFLALLVETIARLARAKPGSYCFSAVLALQTRILPRWSGTVKAVSINKFGIVPKVLTKVNLRRDSGLRPRREIITRVL